MTLGIYFVPFTQIVTDLEFLVNHLRSKTLNINSKRTRFVVNKMVNGRKVEPLPKEVKDFKSKVLIFCLSYNIHTIPNIHLLRTVFSLIN